MVEPLHAVVADGTVTRLRRSPDVASLAHPESVNPRLFFLKLFCVLVLFQIHDEARIRVTSLVHVVNRQKREKIGEETEDVVLIYKQIR